MIEITPQSYYRLCDRAAALGIPASLDDPDAPATVAELAERVVLAEQQAWIPWAGGPFPLRAEILDRYGLAA